MTFESIVRLILNLPMVTDIFIKIPPFWGGMITNKPHSRGAYLRPAPAALYTKAACKGRLDSNQSPPTS
jgi:hypothetical protein